MDFVIPGCRPQPPRRANGQTFHLTYAALFPSELNFEKVLDAAKAWSPLATPEECNTLARNYVAVTAPPESFLYVSIGSGVSILEVHRDRADGVCRYRRVGGSSVGGSTFWGLVRLLTSCSTFDEVIRA